MKVEKVDATNFKSFVGSLRQLMCTRLDILYATGLISRYMETPITTRLKVIIPILCYIKGTIGFGLQFSTSNEYKLVDYNDID